MNTIIEKKRQDDIQRPLICTPLVGDTIDALQLEVAEMIEKEPDLMEWRIDFFAKIAEPDEVIRAARLLKRTAQHIPILFTRRSTREGGAPISISEAAVAALYRAVITERLVDLVDVELNCPSEIKQSLIKLAQKNEIQTVLSYHDFTKTPSKEEIIEKLQQAQREGADVGKVAVMPERLADVLTLTTATEEANRTLAIPIITMSMGKLGAISRLIGGAFGSSVSFAVGKQASAPGQLDIESVKAVLHVIDQSQ